VAQVEGYETIADKDITVVLDTRLTPELKEEGFIRECISKIQTMRKEAGFEVVDHIRVSAKGNEKIEKLYRDVFVATPMDRAVVDDAANAIPVNVATPLPILVTDSSSARHSASTIRIEAVAGSELEDAENTGRDPEAVVIPLRLGHNFTGFRTKLERVDAAASGTFSGLLRLRLGPPDPSMEIDENAPPELSVNGNDTIFFTKAMLDLFSSIMLSATLGIGVMCSAAFVLIFQGLLVLLAGVIAPALTPFAVAEMTCAGSLIMIAIGTNLMGVSKIKVADYLPAILFAPIICAIVGLF
jgi:hypothetical protein